MSEQLDIYTDPTHNLEDYTLDRETLRNECVDSFLAAVDTKDPDIIMASASDLKQFLDQELEPWNSTLHDLRQQQILHLRDPGSPPTDWELLNTAVTETFGRVFSGRSLKGVVLHEFIRYVLEDNRPFTISPLHRLKKTGAASINFDQIYTFE